jgi:triacylglycerol esterase/lipase EstA (alpha/beta hydrolase family)
MSRKRLWPRLTLAAFLLSTWMTVALAGGVAYADTESPPGEASSSQASADTPKASTPDTSAAADSQDRDNPPTRKPRAGHRDTDDGPTTESPPSSETSVPDDPPASVEPSTTASETPAKPDDPPATRVRHSERRDVVAGASAKPPAPPSADPQPSTISATARAEVSPAPQAPDPQPFAAQIQPVAAQIAPTGPAVASTPSGASTIHLPEPRQVVGLISDVGVVAASAVYTVANTIAEAFGPHSFFGVPYALATAVANSAAAVGRTLIGAPLDAASMGPFPVNYGLIDGLAFFNPQKPPPGANDPSITVTGEHPLPIILLNGTTGTQGANWGVGAPVLANAGYKVYTFNYGNVTDDPNYPIQATDDIRQSGLELAAEVDRVLAETGAPQVILIGHSQGGGILPVYYINNLGGADKVSQLIGLAPSNHGTDADGLIGLQALPILGPLLIGFANALGPALAQQTLGNEFQQEVYGNGDTRAGVLYTTIASMNDEVVTPYTQQALDGAGVTNIVLQDLYPGLPVGHEGMVLSPQVWSIVLDALASNPAANPLPQSEELVA